MLAPVGPIPGSWSKQLRDPLCRTARRVAEPAQVTAPVLGDLRRRGAEHGRGPLVIAPVVAAAERVHPVLPARFGHPGRGAVPGREQLPGRRDGDGRGDPGAQQRREDMELVSGW